MKIYVCRICGEVYIGESIPPSCPFCGVANKFLRLVKAWKEENKGIELTDISRENLKKALDLELSNTAFYDCVAKSAESIEVAKMFKGLMKVEKEHAKVFQKLLGLEELPQVEERCTVDPIVNVTDSRKREERAVAFYEAAAKATTEPWVKEIFEAIRDVEKDHIILDEAMLRSLQDIEG